jgi:hypothetical protein
MMVQHRFSSISASKIVFADPKMTDAQGFLEDEILCPIQASCSEN